MTENEIRNILNKIQDQTRKEDIRVTQHAQQEMAEEDISLDEILEAISSGTIIENYPEHRRGSCCLLNGKTENDNPLHIVCTTSLTILIIVTVYRPKLPKWISSTQRRKRNEM